VGFTLVSAILSSATLMLVDSFTTLHSSILIPFVISRLVIGVFIAGVFVTMFLTPMNANNIHYLNIAGIMFLLAYLLETYSILMLNSINSQHQVLSYQMFAASQYLITIAPALFLYYVITYFKRDATFLEFSPVFIDMAIETIFQPLGITSFITTLVIQNNEVKYWVYSPTKFWINVAYYISIAWLVIYMVYLVSKSRSQTVSDIAIEQQNIFLIGIFTVFMVSPLVFFFNNFISNPFIRFYWIAVVGRSFVVIGLTLFIVTFYRSSEKIDFFQPQPLDALYVLNSQTGAILYRKEYRKSHNSEVLEGIVTNVTIINKMLRDALGITSLMTSLDFVDRQLFIETDEQKELIIMLLVEYETSVIKNSFQALHQDLQLLRRFDIPVFEKKLNATFRM
jgi:hypothetical protein